MSGRSTLPPHPRTTTRHHHTTETNQVPRDSQPPTIPPSLGTLHVSGASACSGDRESEPSPLQSDVNQSVHHSNLTMYGHVVLAASLNHSLMMADFYVTDRPSKKNYSVASVVFSFACGDPAQIRDAVT